MPNIFVPVVDQEQHPLMPTIPSRARRWIKSRKVTGFWKGGLFCVRLGVEPSARGMQPLAVGVDPGSKQEGIVVASAAHTYTNIKAKTKPNKRRWNRSFSPLEVGKQWFYEELSKLAPVQTRRGYQQLHRFEPEKGGSMSGKLSLHDPKTGKRLTQSAKVADCRRIKVLRWKKRLAPLTTAK